MPFQVELIEQAVVGRHLALALEDADGDRGLAVLGRAEDVLPLGGNGGVAFDQPGHHAAQGFDAQRQRSDVEQQHVLHFAGQHATLNRGADGHDFVRIDPLVRLLAKDLLDDLLHLGNAGRTADENHFVDFAGLQLGVLEGLQHRPTATLDQVIDQLLELAARDGRFANAWGRWRRP